MRRKLSITVSQSEYLGLTLCACDDILFAGRQQGRTEHVSVEMSVDRDRPTCEEHRQAIIYLPQKE